MPCQSNESHNIMIPEPIMPKNVSPHCMICPLQYRLRCSSMTGWALSIRKLNTDWIWTCHVEASSLVSIYLNLRNWKTVTIHSHSKRQAGRFPYGSLSQINLGLPSLVQLSCSIYQILKFNHLGLAYNDIHSQMVGVLTCQKSPRTTR